MGLPSCRYLPKQGIKTEIILKAVSDICLFREGGVSRLGVHVEWSFGVHLLPGCFPLCLIVQDEEKQLSIYR